MAAFLEQFYAMQPVDSWLAEAPTSLHHTIPEKLVRCLWFDQRWRPPVLRTLDGEAILVHSPGRWNLHAGPDFQHAVIEFAGGERRRGDVEIHCYASGWIAHRHHLDPRYNRLILHVFLWHDRRTTAIKRADGCVVPQVALAEHLPHTLETYSAAIALEDYPHKHVPQYGRCYETLRQLERFEARQFLDRAGDTRLWHRARRWVDRGTEVGLAQVMYEAVLRSLGSMGYRQQFQALARLVSWQELQGCLYGVPAPARGRAAEALLLGLAGILPRGNRVSMDRETQRYAGELQAYWADFPLHIQQRAWRDVTWRQPHVRPANTPERRLAGMAQLLAQYSTTNILEASLTRCRMLAGTADTIATPRALCQALTDMFDGPAVSYWAQRARFAGRQGKPQRLIGRQRALTIVIDAILPVLLLYAQDCNDTALHASLLACYHAAPRLPDNHLLRYMSRCLLGNDPELLALITGARQQQGVLQIFDDFCGNDEGNCQGCNFPLFKA